jgi:hypothetical protein
MKALFWFRRRWDYGKESSTDYGLLTAAEPRSIEQVIYELSAEQERLSSADPRWWELSRKIKVLKS